jgi:membrane associated rhomboid family serine protease
VGAYLVLYPKAPIVTFNSVFPLWFVIGVFPVVPAWLIAGEFFLINLLQGLGSLGIQMRGGVAFFAHLGGFVAGLLLVRLWAREPHPATRWQGFRSGARRRRR